MNLAKTIKISHLWRTIKTNNMKQTAVEWLIRVLELESFENINLYSMKAIEQAKEMEKEQIIDAFNQGNIYEGNFFDRVNITAENYYNETFKQ
jgi:hypothetical protein